MSNDIIKGRYYFEKIIGRGAQAVVLLVTDKEANNEK